MPIIVDETPKSAEQELQTLKVVSLINSWAAENKYNALKKELTAYKKHCGLHMKSHVGDHRILLHHYPDFPFDVPKEIWELRNIPPKSGVKA